MKNELRNQARDLRKQGRSINSIYKEIGASKGSVSIWVRDIILTAEQNDRLIASHYTTENAVKGAEANRKKYSDLRISARLTGEHLAKQSEDLRLISALYWGEGAKGRGGFEFSNSDPSMIKLVIDWLNKNKFDYRLKVYSYLENGLSENDILDWWEANIGRRPVKWYAQKISRASQQKNIGKLPYGTCHINARQEPQLLVLGAIEYLKKLNLAV